ncbi:MAG: hypothetical protein AAFZ63_29255 [Bacteroidota bacterium]
MAFRPLHQLLHALTAQEKEVVRHAFEDRKQSKQLLVFRYLDGLAGDFYQEHFEKFCQTHGLTDANLRKIKQRLTDDIVNLLREYHAAKDPIFKLQQLLANVRLLVQKERFELAKDELKKASKQEKKINSAGIRYEIQALMLEILFLEDHKNIDSPLQDHLDQVDQAAEEFRQNATINRIYHALYRYGIRRKGQKSWEELAEELQRIPFPKKLDLVAKFRYISAKMKIASLQRDHQKVLKWAKKGYEIFTEKPEYRSRESYIRYFIAIIDHNLMALILLGRYNKLSPLLKELEELVIEEPMYEAKRYATLIYYRLTAFCNSQSPKTDIQEKEIETLKVHFEKYQQGMLPARRLTIEFMFSCIYFLRHDYANAEGYFRKFDIHKSNHLRPDILRIILVMQTIVAADDEQQEFDIVDPLINRNTTRLEDWNGLHRYERIAFRYCNRLNEARGMWRREREDLYVKFYFELEATKDADTGRYHPGAEILMKWLLPKLPDSPDSLAA